MNIAMIAPMEERVPPQKYGGIELVVYNLTEELVRMGHRVTLFASGNSRTSAKLIPIFESEIRRLPEVRDRSIRQAYHLLSVAKVAEYIVHHRFDVIHNHIGVSFLPFTKVMDQPTVITLHGSLVNSYIKKIYSAYRHLNFVSISYAQRTPLPVLNYVGNVYNGINPALFPFYPNPQDYVAFLGRITPEKGPLQAIEVARRAGVRLVIGAKVDPVDVSFFRRKVKPLIDGTQVQYIGEVDHAEKIALLGNAKALLAPIQWDEPFGLYFIEAMACGTPVIAIRRGSVPEVVQDKKTGFICDNIEEMVDAVRDVHRISRQACFDFMHRDGYFSSREMARGYLTVYKKVVRKHNTVLGANPGNFRPHSGEARRNGMSAAPPPGARTA